MKKTNISISILFATSLLISSCGDSKKKETKTEIKTTQVEIPKWENRMSTVGDTREMAKMYETYLSISDEIKANPKDYASRLKMADLFIVEARATGNYGHYYPAAVKMIDGVLADNPTSKDDLFRAYTSKAVILLSLHKFSKAKEMGEKALALNPYNSRVYGILADANVELGNYGEAIVMADSMVAKRPDLRSYSRVSYMRELHGDIAGAKKAMEMAVKAGYPGHEETSWSQVTLGHLYENYGDLESAEKLYQLALQERENYPFALSGLASVHLRKKNYDSSITLLKEAIKIRPEPAFYEDLAYVNMCKADKEAFEATKKDAFVALRGLSEDDHKDEDGTVHTHENGEGAHSHDDSAAKDNEHGHSHETGLEMAKLYLKLTDDYEEALHHILHEYSIRPKNIEVNEVLAEVYYRSGKYDLAEEHFNTAMATNIKDPELLLLGGLIHAKTGDKAKAKSLIAESMELNPYQTSKMVSEAKAI